MLFQNYYVQCCHNYIKGNSNIVAEVQTKLISTKIKKKATNLLLQFSIGYLSI